MKPYDKQILSKNIAISDRLIHTSNASLGSPKNDLITKAALSMIANEGSALNSSKTLKFNVDGKEQKVSVEPHADGFKMQIGDGDWKNVSMTKNGNAFNAKIDGSDFKYSMSVTPDHISLLNERGKEELKISTKSLDRNNLSNSMIPIITASGASGSQILYYLGAFIMAIQWVVFLHAGGFFGNERTEKYYDLTGSLTYLSAIGLSLYLTPNLGIRQIILSSFVGVWAARLGYFLYTRIHNNAGIDSRFETIKKNNFKFLFAWTMQGVWVFTCLFPVLKLTQVATLAPLTSLDYAGFGLWAFGFIFEVIADYQKSKFRSNPENKNKFIDSGLWSISRHPNYFGEILLWTGISLAAYSGTKSPAVFITPAFVSLLLIYMSGIPMLEKSANEKFGSDPKFQDYKKNTPVLIPFIGRKGDASF